MTDKLKRLRWRRQPNERGLAMMVQGERGYVLVYGDEEVGWVRPLYQGFQRTIVGYYWYGFDVNTSSKPVLTVEAAKAACEAHARKKLGLREKK